MTPKAFPTKAAFVIAHPKAKLLDPLPKVHAAIFGPIRPGVKSIRQGWHQTHRGAAEWEAKADLAGG